MTSSRRASACSLTSPSKFTIASKWPFVSTESSNSSTCRLTRSSKTPFRSDDFLPESVGMQPYITIEIYDRLKVAFREYRKFKQQHLPTDAVEQDAVLYAGWMGHYVGDGSNPLHTTVSHDGWVGPNPNGYTTEKGIHPEFEGRFVTRTIDQMNLHPLVHEPVRLKDPWHDYLQYLRDSNRLVEKVYQLEKAGALKDTATPDSREFLRERLAAGAQMLLNLWYTAWEESALPVPPRNPTPAITNAPPATTK